MLRADGRKTRNCVQELTEFWVWDEERNQEYMFRAKRNIGS